MHELFPCKAPPELFPGETWKAAAAGLPQRLAGGRGPAGNGRWRWGATRETPAQAKNVKGPEGGSWFSCWKSLAFCDEGIFMLIMKLLKINVNSLSMPTCSRPPCGFLFCFGFFFSFAFRKMFVFQGINIINTTFQKQSCNYILLFNEHFMLNKLRFLLLLSSMLVSWCCGLFCLFSILFLFCYHFVWTWRIDTRAWYFLVSPLTPVFICCFSRIGWKCSMFFLFLKKK